MGIGRMRLAIGLTLSIVVVGCSATAEPNADPSRQPSQASPTSAAGPGVVGNADEPGDPTDGRKNGDETDVDCGGASGKKCVAGQTCKGDGDCAAEACRAGTCAVRKSCRAVSGGGTCGSGEVGTPNARHEDCCTTLDVPRPADEGGPYRVDKYLVTAGRMRAFIEEVDGNVKGWVADHAPPGWTSTWTKSVPGDRDEARLQLGVGQTGATSYPTGSLGPGCYVNGQGAPAYWFSQAEQERSGDIARAFTKDELDTKALNCATKALFAAFCWWDGGGRLPTAEEWKYVATANETTYPWGADASIGDHASYNFNYFWPRALGAGDLDRGAFLPAPGRFPQGAGPFGHMDVAGALETFTDKGGIMQYSFQEAGKEDYGIPYGRVRTWGPSTKHWAIGARCVYDVK